MEDTQLVNLNITKDESKNPCPLCFKDYDQLIWLTSIIINYHRHLICSSCNNYYCILCIKKESLDKHKYPRCRRKYCGAIEGDVNDNFIKCNYKDCPKQAKLKGFCRLHYNHKYYMNKIRPQKRRNGSRKAHTQKRFPKFLKLKHNAQIERSIDNVKKDNN